MLDRTIESGKEHRKKYRGAKAVDRTCRNHGSCKYCTDTRLHSFHQYNQETLLKLTEFYEETHTIHHGKNVENYTKKGDN